LVPSPKAGLPKPRPHAGRRRESRDDFPAAAGLILFLHFTKGPSIMLPRSRCTLLAFGVVMGSCLWLGTFSTSAKGEPAPQQKKDAKPDPKTDATVKPNLKKIATKAFMRKKLTASQDILEGLAVEDFDLIEKGATSLKAMSVAAEFMVVEDPIYAVYADDFRRAVGRMEKAAKEKRLDGATLGFMDMTMNCVECHKHVRTILVAQ